MMMMKHEHEAQHKDAEIHCQVCYKEIPSSLAKRLRPDTACDFKWFFCGPQCHSLWEQGMLED